MKKLIIILLLFVFFGSSYAQDPFELYEEKDKSWNASIYELYIKQYAGIDVDKVMIDATDLTSIIFLLEEFPHETTTDINLAINAVDEGEKVFFFVETYVWGGLNTGSVKSGSWQMDMPLCSGFYIYEKKCFQNEGINFHCGKKETAREVTYVIMK